MVKHLILQHRASNTPLHFSAYTYINRNTELVKTKSNTFTQIYQRIGLKTKTIYNNTIIPSKHILLTSMNFLNVHHSLPKNSHTMRSNIIVHTIKPLGNYYTSNNGHVPTSILPYPTWPLIQNHQQLWHFKLLTTSCAIYIITYMNLCSTQTD